MISMEKKKQDDDDIDEQFIEKIDVLSSLTENLQTSLEENIEKD